jgi:hypothetical protein
MELYIKCGTMPLSGLSQWARRKLWYRLNSGSRFKFTVRAHHGGAADFQLLGQCPLGRQARPDRQISAFNRVFERLQQLAVERL